MSVLVDTSFVIALKNLDDEDHPRAVSLFQELLRGIHGATYTTNFVFAESISVALARMQRRTAAIGVGEMFVSTLPGGWFMRLQHVSPEQLLDAWREFRRHADKDLGLVDWTTVVLARHLGLGAIVSFDAGFDGIFPRLA